MSARHDDVQSAVFLALLVAAGALALAIAWPFLTYLLAAALLAFVLFPVQRRLAPRIGERPAALVLVLAAVSATVAVVGVLVAALPADASEVSRMLRQTLEEGRVEARLEDLLGTEVPLESIVAGAPRQLAELLVGDLSGIVAAATHAFLGLLLLLFVLYYLLADGEALVDWTRRMAPLPPAVQSELYTEAHQTTWAVLKGHVLIAFVQGIVAGAGLLLVGIPNVVFWTVVMMFLELFPVVGVAAVLGPAVVYLAATERLVAAGFLFVYGLTAVAVVDDYLRAYVVDRASSLHSAVVLVGVFGGVYVFGVMGLFYGPVVVGLFGVLVRLFDEYYAAGA